MPRKKPQSHFGVRVPKLRQRRDGRWFTRSRVGGKARDTYFGRANGPTEAAEIQKKYQLWALNFAARQLGENGAQATPTRAALQNPSNAPALLHEHFQFWFECICVRSASRKAKQNARNATHGKFDKAYYAARNLGELIQALTPRRPDQLGLEVADELAELALRVVQCEDKGARWSLQKLNGVISMLSKFAGWALERGVVSPQLAAALKRSSLFELAKEAARPNTSRERSRGLNDEDLRDIRIGLAKDPLWLLVFEIQLLNGARASEVLGLRRDQLVLDQREIVEFAVPHKTEHHRSARERRIAVAGESLPMLRWLLGTVGNDHLFTRRSRSLMRELSAAQVRNPTGDPARYNQSKVPHSRFNHNQYRKRLQELGACATHAVRRRAITAVAHSKGNEAAMEFAGHLDPRMLRTYVAPNREKIRNIILGRAEHSSLP